MGIFRGNKWEYLVEIFSIRFSLPLWCEALTHSKQAWQASSDLNKTCTETFMVYYCPNVMRKWSGFTLNQPYISWMLACIDRLLFLSLSRWQSTLATALRHRLDPNKSCLPSSIRLNFILITWTSILHAPCPPRTPRLRPLEMLKFSTQEPNFWFKNH